MDDLQFDKLLRAQHAAGEAVRAVADVLAVDRGIADAPTEGTRLAGLDGIKATSRTLRESAAILLQAAHAIDGLDVLIETHPDAGR
jgi:hypothetical protein